MLDCEPAAGGWTKRSYEAHLSFAAKSFTRNPGILAGASETSDIGIDDDSLVVRPAPIMMHVAATDGFRRDGLGGSNSPAVPAAHEAECYQAGSGDRPFDNRHPRRVRTFDPGGRAGPRRRPRLRPFLAFFFGPPAAPSSPPMAS